MYIKSHIFSLPANITQHPCQDTARIVFPSPSQFYSPGCIVIQFSLGQDSPLSRHEGFFSWRLKPLKLPPGAGSFRTWLSACPITNVEEPVCYNQRTLARNEEFTMVNQLGTTGERGSITWKVLSLSWVLIKQAGLGAVLLGWCLCWTDCSLRGWTRNEKTLWLAYNTHTSSYASAPFPMVLYLKCMCTDSNDKAYPWYQMAGLRESAIPHDYQAPMKSLGQQFKLLNHVLLWESAMEISVFLLLSEFT